MQKGFSGVLILVVLGILSAIGGSSFYLFNKQQLATINSFEECAKKYPVMESFPKQCNTTDGRHFVEAIKSSTSSSQFIGQNKLSSPSLSDSYPVQQISGLKTFKDEIVGIEFSYPENWLFQDKNNGLYRYIVFGPATEINHVGQKVSPYPADYVTLSFYPIKQNQSIEQARNLGKDMIITQEDIKVAGLNAKKITHKGCVSADCTEIIFSNQKILFVFSVENSSNPNFPEYLKEVTETFKLLR